MAKWKAMGVGAESGQSAPCPSTIAPASDIVTLASRDVTLTVVALTVPSCVALGVCASCGIGSHTGSHTVTCVRPCGTRKGARDDATPASMPALPPALAAEAAAAVLAVPVPWLERV